ncbi:MAG: hypothetical protein ACFFCR_12065 [Promethearchaeota archaeon]
MEIPVKGRNSVLMGLLVIALLIPFITMVTVHAEGIHLDLTYEYLHFYRQIGSENTNETSETYSISVGVSLDNLSLALSGEEFEGYPVWANVSMWSEGDTVQLGGQEVTILSSQTRYGFYCWVAEDQNGTDIYYHKEFGIFLGSYYWESFWLEDSFSVWETREIFLTNQNIDDFNAVQFMYNTDAILFSAILIESVILVPAYERRETT